MEKKEKKKTEKEVSWFRPDLSYEHLNQIKISVSSYAGGNDLIGWYNALESEYRFVWHFIKEFAENNEHDQKYFEGQWTKARSLLYNPRNELETVTSDRLKVKNYSAARDILHNINLLLNEYEAEANLVIQQETKAPGGLEGVGIKYKLKND